MAREHGNLHAAVEYCLNEPGEAEQVLYLAVTLPLLYWWALGGFGDGRRWLDSALAECSPWTPTYARALLLSGYLAACQGDLATATECLRRGQRLSRRLADPGTRALAAYIDGSVASLRNDLPAATAALERALQIVAGMPRPHLELRVGVLLALGVNAGLAGDRDRSRACLREVLSITGPRGGRYYRSCALWAIGMDSWRRGALEDAVFQLAAGLRIKVDTQPVDRYGIGLCLETLAWVAADTGRHEDAGTLLGAAAAEWAEMGTTIRVYGHLLAYHDRCEWRVRTALGQAAYRTAFARGAALGQARAAGYALDLIPRLRAGTAAVASAGTSTAGDEPGTEP